MPKRFIHSDNFLRGLQTTRIEDGKPLPEFETFQNVRVGSGVAKRRAGMRLVDIATNDVTALEFDGMTQYIQIPVDSRAHDLGKTWTVEALVQPTSISGDHYILGAATASTIPLTIRVNSSGNVVAVVTDSGSTATTLTSSSTFSAATTLAIQVVRDGTSLTLRVNSASEATGSIADLDLYSNTAALQIACSNTTNYFHGIIDYVRCYGIALADQSNAKIRCVYPRAPYVLWDYVMEDDDTTNYVLDQSRYGNTGLSHNTPASANCLCHHVNPVWMIAPRLASDGRQKVTVHAGKTIYDTVLD